MSLINKSLASAYLTSDNCLYPGTQAQATALQTQARLDIAQMVPTKTGSTPALTNGVITIAP